MENQHRKIIGYRDLTQEEIDLMNDVKALGERLRELDLKILQHVHAQIAERNPSTDERHKVAEPGRWLSIGRTKLQEGIMALTRAVAQPTSF